MRMSYWYCARRSLTFSYAVSCWTERKWSGRVDLNEHLRSDQQPCWRVRDAGSKAPVWSAMIVVSRALSHHHPKVAKRLQFSM
jgi:hypothetical protein